MKKKTMLLIAVPVVLIVVGLIFVVLSSADDERLKDALREAGIEQDVQEVYTDRAIASGQVISAQDVYEAQIPLGDVRAEAFLCMNDVIGKRIVGAMEPNQFLTVQDVGLRKEDVLKIELDRLKDNHSNKNALCPHASDSKLKLPEKVIYKATRGIPEGERIKASDIKAVPAEENETKDCAGDARLIVNHVAKYGLESGQIFSLFDVVTVGKEQDEDAFVAARDLKPGETVKPTDIVEKHFEKGKCSVNAILDKSLIEGSKVVQPIAKDQVFRLIDLVAPSPAQASEKN